MTTCYYIHLTLEVAAYFSAVLLFESGINSSDPFRGVFFALCAFIVGTSLGRNRLLSRQNHTLEQIRTVTA